MPGFAVAYSGLPFSGDPVLLSLEKDTMYVRVFDAEAARLGGYQGHDWNPTTQPISAGPDKAGRFDPLPPGIAHAGYLYGCENRDGAAKVALIEVFKPLLKRRPDGRNYIERAERDKRSIVKFRLREPVNIIDIRRQKGREPFRMGEEILYTGDRQVSREWSDAIKNKITEYGGLGYNSTLETSQIGDACFIIWQDRVRNDLIEPVDVVDLKSDEGIRLVNDALVDYNVHWT